MARRKRRKKPLIHKLMIQADHAVSVYVREQASKEWRGKCPLCNDNPIQCCFHFIRRKRKILRWDIRNLVGACHRCNYIEYRNPDPSRAWFIRYRGVELYLRLVDESKESFEPTEEYLRGIIQKYGSAGDV